ncbi:hypothetical protein G3580_02470 [Nitrogeniibacter mangrovi]|uniref:Cytochrome C n=2 Tax=Nitrogeniibacter mangrovi TaxID=2016596 RepID=A0A6C1B8I5_9RHOO|nr:hypothetical protein G3580_02470 [Nitrogeniibacter mangrovi]
MLLLSLPGHAQQHDPAMHAHTPGMAAPADSRERVHFPDAMVAHTLASMRDHLAALQEIQAALASGHYDHAAEVAEQRLGMSALVLHGAAESSKFMPEGMQAAGSKMHHSASRFAIAARDAGVTGDLAPALKGLAEVTAACVQCHSGYRLR